MGLDTSATVFDNCCSKNAGRSPVPGGFIVIDTVAMLLSAVPSLALKVNESEPVKPVL